MIGVTRNSAKVPFTNTETARHENICNYLVSVNSENDNRARIHEAARAVGPTCKDILLHPISVSSVVSRAGRRLSMGGCVDVDVRTRSVALVAQVLYFDLVFKVTAVPSSNCDKSDTP